MPRDWVTTSTGTRSKNSASLSHPDDRNGSMFWGVNHCVNGKPNPYYEAAVRYYLKSTLNVKL